MDRTKLISCFRDTLKWSYSERLCYSTEMAQRSNKVYNEHFVSTKGDYKECADILVEENTSFAAARKYAAFGKTVVLNFANPEVPGGGVENGAMAQEECLCRSSNLYSCLSTENVFEDYYRYHRSLRSYFYSDRLIYTRDIIVFKDDSVIPQLMSEDEWFKVDVITCAAPYLGKSLQTNGAVLKDIFKKRIKNIFEAAYDNGAEVLILGAFGCGAFKNPPQVVASAFYEVINEEKYDSLFKKIIFAIKPSREYHCPNVEAFRRRFSEEMCTVFAEEWRDSSCYSNMNFSILGDSISTLDGYNPWGYKLFYTGDVCDRAHIKEMKDTWWGKVISHLCGELLVNNSWSGSRVTKLPDRAEVFPSGCSDERTSSLHINSVLPDVIIVYLGTNDWAFGAPIGTDVGLVLATEEFRFAYGLMLRKLRQNYPEAEIWCCTLCTTYISENLSFQFPYAHAGKHIELYNNAIREVASKQCVRLIDLYSSNEPYDSLDGSHPTAKGMETLAKLIIKEMEGKRSVVEECVVTTENEYVMLPADITSIFFGDNLKLTNEHTGQTIEIQEKQITVGRAENCTICLKDAVMVARQHATFWYEREMWFVQDNASTNGTWLNGVKLEPEKKYQLAVNDVIEFAQSERFVFHKLGGVVQQERKKITLIGSIIAEAFNVLELVGKGMCSECYLVMHRATKRLFAMKVYDKQGMFVDALVQKAIYQEVNFQKSFNHPAIPAIIDMIDEMDYLYIIEEYVDGITLSDLLKRMGTQPVEKVIDWGMQICDVLHYLHTLNPPHIHRDIKPLNLMHTVDRKIKLIDFNIMRVYTLDGKADETVLGTRGYAPPEQYAGHTDWRTDIYALGVTMMQLLTGVDPRKYESELPRIRDVYPLLPQFMEDIIVKCTQKNPKDRYQSVEELKRDLEKKKSPYKGFLKKFLSKQS